MGDIAPYLLGGDAMIAFARPIFAELEYMRDHVGQRPTDPAQRCSYLKKPLNEWKILRDLKLAVDGDKVKMNFSVNADLK